MATRAPGTTTPHDTTSASPTPSKPSSQPTVDPQKTTTTDTYTKSPAAITTTTVDPPKTTIITTATVDPPKTTTTDTHTISSEATTTTTRAASITTTDKPATTIEPPPIRTTTTTMSTAEPPATTKDPPVTTTEPPVTTTATNPPVTTTDPPVTTTTTGPPVTTTTADPPVTTTTTTKDPPVTTITTTKDPPVTTTTPTKDPPVVTTTTTDHPVRTTTATTTPYTTRYVTTLSIVTVTTLVPETTVISGRGTTVYITRSTTTPVPTIIQDPTQDPPPGTQVDSSAKGGLQTWQITLIIVAALVMMGAVGAVVLVGRIKRQRRKRDTMLFSGDGLESVQGSEMSESGGGKSNRTLLVGGQQKHYHSGQNGGGGGGLFGSRDTASGGGGGWRERLSAWRPWDSHGSYHHQQQHPEGLDYNQRTGQGGGGGGLWLMDEPDPHYDRSAAAAGVAASMRPVSYDTGGSGLGDPTVGEEDPYYYGNYPYNNSQAQDGHYDQEEAPYAATAMVTAPRRAAGTLHPQDDIVHPSVQRGPSSVASATTAMTPRSQQSHLQQLPNRGSLTGQISPSFEHQERLSSEEGSDYIDSHSLHRQSQDGTLSSVTSAGAGVGVGTGTGAIEDRTSTRVEPDQLERHGLFEHFRKAPQAILGTSPSKAQSSVGGKSPPLPSAPPSPPSNTTATDTETAETIADGDKEKNNTVPESHPSTATLLSVESTSVSKPVSLVPEQQQQQPPQ